MASRRAANGTGDRPTPGRTCATAGTGGTIPQRFAGRVDGNPARLAVTSHGAGISYGDLDRLSSRLAHFILSRIGDRAAPVSILMDKRVEWPAAVLGALKAGKIYVPMDPRLPGARNERILRDAQAELVLTDREHLALAREISPAGTPVAAVEDVDPHCSSARPALTFSPDRPAWIIYTSGSTGAPKGVVQTHENVLHYVADYADRLHITPEDRFTLLFSPGVNGAARPVRLSAQRSLDPLLRLQPERPRGARPVAPGGDPDLRRGGPAREPRPTGSHGPAGRIARPRHPRSRPARVREVPLRGPSSHHQAEVSGQQKANHGFHHFHPCNPWFVLSFPAIQTVECMRAASPAGAK